MNKKVHNPAIGHSVTFLQTAEQTNGELLQIEYGVEKPESELRFITDVRPPGELQTYWETVFGLAEDGKVNDNGLPNPLQLAVLAPLADSYDPRVPVPVMKGLIAILGGLGRLAGYRAKYPEYST